MRDIAILFLILIHVLFHPFNRVLHLERKRNISGLNGLRYQRNGKW